MKKYNYSSILKIYKSNLLNKLRDFKVDDDLALWVPNDDITESDINLIDSVDAIKIKITFDELIQGWISHLHHQTIIQFDSLSMLFILLNLNIVQVDCNLDLSFIIIWAGDINLNLLTHGLATNVEEEILNIKRRQILYLDALG